MNGGAEVVVEVTNVELVDDIVDVVEDSVLLELLEVGERVLLELLDDVDTLELLEDVDANELLDDVVSLELLDDVDVLELLEEVLDEVLEDTLEDVDDSDVEDEDGFVSGTPPGPATICKIFSVAVELKIVGARDI